MDFSSSGFVHTIIYASSYLISMSIYRMYKEQQFGTETKQERYRRKRLKIVLIGFPTFLCAVHSYSNLFQKCHIDVVQNSKVGMGILISLYMSFVLYVGPIYHEFWVYNRCIKNGKLKKKLGKLTFNKFRWDYFTKIVVIPIIEELLFRGFAKNSFNSEFQNNNFYLIYTTLLYLIVRLILFVPKAAKCKGYLKEAFKSFLLGIYLSYVLVQTETVAAAIINHGCINFMGSPNIKDLLRGDYSHELRFKILRFYCLGFFAFLIFCLLVL